MTGTNLPGTSAMPAHSAVPGSAGASAPSAVPGPAPIWPPGTGPRILIGTYALDQHEAGAQYIARLLRDAGAEVIYLGRFNLPEHIAAVAVQEDADVIGMSCHSWEYLACTRELLAALARSGRDVPVVLGGAVITPADAADLQRDGVAAVFGPGAAPADILASIHDITTRPH